MTRKTIKNVRYEGRDKFNTKQKLIDRSIDRSLLSFYRNETSLTNKKEKKRMKNQGRRKKIEISKFF